MADNNKVFDLLSKMYSELTNKIDGIHSEMQEMKSDFNNKFDNLEKQVSKNSIMLEKMDSNIKLLAEGQEAFREQIGRNNEKDARTVTDRLETIEIAVTHTSKAVNALNETVEVVKETAASNDLDIKILKRLQKTSI